MRKSLAAESADDIIQDHLAQVELWRCHQCGQCTAVCPSGRHGGIRVREVLERAATGNLDVASDRDIWLCTMCNSCSERCQLGADPALVITLLRGSAAAKGNRPQHFLEEAKLFFSTGLSFPCTGMTKKLRKELKLPDLQMDERTLEETKVIISRTRLGRIKLE